MHKLQNKVINNTSSGKKTSGFSLIELIVVLLIGSILLAWGVPNYRDFKIRKDVSMNVNEMTYSFNLARAEAIRYGTDVKVRLTAGTWPEGWEVWTLNEDGSEIEQIYIQDPLTEMDIDQTDGTAGELVFNSIGALEGGGTVTFEVDNKGAPVTGSQRNILVLPNGSARVVNP